MTLEITHEFITNHFDGDNQNICHKVLGENMRELRKSELKLRHVSDQCKRQSGTIFKRALKS